MGYLVPKKAEEYNALWRNLAQAETVQDFGRHWLAIQCDMIPGVSGAMVLLGKADSGPYTPAAVWPNPQQSLKYLTSTAERALVERRGLLLKREANGDAEAPPRERYEVAYPIEVSGRLHGVVVLDITPRAEPQLQAVLRELHWGSAWLEVLLLRDESENTENAKGRLQAVFDLVASSVVHDRFFASATEFVNTMTTKMKCDRVSLGFTRRGRVQVAAMSNSAKFGRHTNLIRAIGAAMDEARDQNAVVVYPPPPDGEVHVTRAHADLSRQSDGGSICSIPLQGGGHPFGVLTLERSADWPFDPPAVEVCEADAALAGPMMELQKRNDRWLPAKVVESFRNLLGRLFGPGHLVLKLVAFCLAGLIILFSFLKIDYRVTAKTLIEARIQRAAVAPLKGYIADAFVRAGDLVRKGATLVRLDDRELRLERFRTLSQRHQLKRQYHRALADRNAAEVKIFTAQIEESTAQLGLLDEQLSRTKLVAPFDAVVVSGDLSQSLGAPVERGQVLFELAPLNAYRIALQVNERDIAGIAYGQKGHLLLSAFPTQPLAFTIRKITPVSTASEGENFFRVEARLDRKSDRLRPGMEGVGKIEIDRRLPIWVWTHQALDWVRLMVWSWAP